MDHQPSTSTSDMDHQPSTSTSDMNHQPSTSMPGINQQSSASKTGMDHQTPTSRASVVQQITPDQVRPLPKAGIRKAAVNRGKKKLASSILTDTPVKESLRIEQNERKAKKQQIQEKKSSRAMKVAKVKEPKKSTKVNTAPQRKKKQPSRKLVLSDVESSDESLPASDEEGSQIQNLCMDTDDDDIEFDTETVRVGDWCLFEYFNDSKLYYVGRIVRVNDKKVMVDFLQFMFRNNDDKHAKFLEKANGVCEAELDQIVLKLDTPMQPTMGSKRQSAYLQFPFDFSSYKLGK